MRSHIAYISDTSFVQLFVIYSAMRRFVTSLFPSKCLTFKSVVREKEVGKRMNPATYCASPT